MKRIIVLGGGPSGLSCAWKIGDLLDSKIDVYEKEDRIGGVCGYHEFGGLRMDYGPHKIYSLLPGIMDEFRRLAGDRISEHKKRHKLIIRGKMLNYPVRLSDALRIFSYSEIVELGCTVFLSLCKQPFLKEASSYQEYCLNIFGSKLYREIFFPLADKIWGDPGRLSADIARRRIPVKSAWELVSGALGMNGSSFASDAETILYPNRGFYDICECMRQKIHEKGGRVHTGIRPVRIERSSSRVKRVVFSDGSLQDADILVSTIPLKELLGLLSFEDLDMRDPGKFISMRNAVIVYLLIDRPKVCDEHWIFCSDRDVVFSRIAEQKLFLGPEFAGQRTVISCDFTCDDKSEFWTGGEDLAAEHCVRGLEKLGLIAHSDVLDRSVARIPAFYPVYEKDFQKRLDNLLGIVNRMENVICCGRLGLCNYNNIDHCLDMGIYTASKLAQGSRPSEINMSLSRKANDYRIVD